MLTGKYSKDDESILVVLDTSESIAYSVTLPDLRSPMGKEFSFKNIPYGQTGANVTIQTSNNQVIDGRYFTHTIAPYDMKSFMSNKKDTWVIMGAGPIAEINNEIYLGRNGLPYWKIHVDSVGALNIDYDTLAGAAASPAWSEDYWKLDGQGTFV